MNAHHHSDRQRRRFRCGCSALVSSPRPVAVVLAALVGLMHAAISVTACTQRVTATQSRPVIRLAAGSWLRDAYRTLMPTRSFEIVVTGASVTQLEALQTGSADIGNATADIAYMASRGQLGLSAGAFDKIRSIAVMQP